MEMCLSLQKSGYKRRIIDEKVEDYLQLFGAILIEGPKWCGKTWTSLNHANSVTYIMDPAGDYSNRTLSRINPAMVLPGEAPHLIDEWQVVPGIWDAVRFEIDQNPGYGKFLLTGSVTPPKYSYEHSGTGRIAAIRMYPMTMHESLDSDGKISLGAILKNVKFEPFTTNIDLIKLIDITIRGGWPETLKLPIKKAGKVAQEYINAVVRSELAHEDHSKRDQAKMRKLLRSLARNNATTASLKTLTMDTDGAERQFLTDKDVSISRDSIADYLKNLKDTFVIEEIPPWNPEIRSKAIMRQAPKRIFVDPSLAIAALGANSERLLHDLKTFGFMFENLCLRDLSVYTEFYGGSIFHYHDNSDLEIDAIVEMPDGAWGAFEIKLSYDQVEAAVKSLLRMKEKMTAAGAEAPACLAVITGGGIARLRDDGVYVLPINALRH
jgi:predicted AAA+ superfamily ATPase